MSNFSLGLLEVSALGHAIIALDAMLKAADVEFVATERKLGGRLVTLVVKGELTSVKAAIDAGIQSAKSNGVYKASNVIARPHEEIYKFLHLDEEHEKPVNSESAATHIGELPGVEIPKESAPETIEPKKPVRRGRRKKAAPADENPTEPEA